MLSVAPAPGYSAPANSPCTSSLPHSLPPRPGPSAGSPLAVFLALRGVNFGKGRGLGTAATAPLNQLAPDHPCSPDGLPACRRRAACISSCMQAPCCAQAETSRPAAFLSVHPPLQWAKLTRFVHYAHAHARARARTRTHRHNTHILMAALQDVEPVRAL